MPLVDLRDGDLDLAAAAPRAALRWDAGTTAGALVGWDEGGELVAWARLERTSADAVVLHALAAAGDPVGCRLVDEIAASTGDATLHVDAAGDAGPFGFRHDGTGWRRDPRPPVAGDEAQTGVVDPASQGLSEVADRVRGAWLRETSADPDEWTPENPARGQCDVTAALVQELVGGAVLVAGVIRDGRRVERHAWNRLPDGTAIDLTREQFPPDIQLEAPSGDGLARLGDFDRRLALLRERASAGPRPDA